MAEELSFLKDVGIGEIFYELNDERPIRQEKVKMYDEGNDLWIIATKKGMILEYLKDRWDGISLKREVLRTRKKI